MEDVLVLILATIEVLSRDRTNRNLIGNYDIIPVIIRVSVVVVVVIVMSHFATPPLGSVVVVVVYSSISQLLYSEKRTLLEHAAGCLCELAKDPFNVQIMERSNCHDLLLKLLQKYQDETIEAYVTMTLQRMDDVRNYDPHRISVNNMDTVSASMLPPAPGNVTPVSCCCCCYSDVTLCYFLPPWKCYVAFERPLVVVVVVVIYLCMIDWRTGLLPNVRRPQSSVLRTRGVRSDEP